MKVTYRWWIWIRETPSSSKPNFMFPFLRYVSRTQVNRLSWRRHGLRLTFWRLLFSLRRHLCKHTIDAFQNHSGIWDILACVDESMICLLWKRLRKEVKKRRRWKGFYMICDRRHDLTHESVGYFASNKPRIWLWLFSRRFFIFCPWDISYSPINDFSYHNYVCTYKGGPGVVPDSLHTWRGQRKQYIKTISMERHRPRS